MAARSLESQLVLMWEDPRRSGLLALPAYAIVLILIYVVILAMKLIGLGDFFFAWVPIALGGLYMALDRSSDRDNTLRSSGVAEDRRELSA